MAETNPNGANQYQLDPRQLLCWKYYTDQKGDTFGNALQSALKAGYEEATANQITSYDWFQEKRRRLGLLDKAEKLLDKTLSYEAVDEQGKLDKDLLRIQTDVSKFIAKTQGKDKGYSERTEHTGADGAPIFQIAEDLANKNAINTDTRDSS